MDYQRVQGAVAAALLADLQYRSAGNVAGRSLLQVAFEEMGLSASAFTVPGIYEFVRGYLNCYYRSAPDGQEVHPSHVLAEMEKLGADEATLQKWRYHLSHEWPPQVRNAAAFRENVSLLVKMDIGRATIEQLRAWLRFAESNTAAVKEEMVVWASTLIGMAEGASETIRPSDILSEADIRGYVPPTPTGWPRLDYALSGRGRTRAGGIFHDEGDIWVVGAPSGHGKSTFTCNLAVNLAKQGFASVVITWEASKVSLVRRMVCNLADISYDSAADLQLAITRGEAERRAEAVDTLSGLVRIYERPQKPSEIAEVIKRHKSEFGEKLRAILIDHIGISREATGDNVWRGLEQLVYALKSLAVQEHVAIIACSQVPEDVEAQLREKNKSFSLNFRGSRGIRMGADVALLMCRHNGKDENGVIQPQFYNTTCIQLSKDRRFGQEDWFLLSYNGDRYRMTEHPYSP